MVESNYFYLVLKNFSKLFLTSINLAILFVFLLLVLFAPRDVVALGTLESPEFISGIDVSGAINSGTGSSPFNDLLVSGSYLYVLGNASATNCNTVGNKIGCELQIYNISDPSNPTFVAGIDSSSNVDSGTGTGTFNDLFVKGGYLYIAVSANSTNCNTVGNKIGCELQIYNISDPSNPTYVAGIDSSSNVDSGTGGVSFNDLFIEGSYLYVGLSANSTNCNTVGNKIGCELQIYNISDPSNPIFVAGIDASGTVNSGTSLIVSTIPYVSGNYLYLGRGSNSTDCNTVGNKIGCELQIYNIADPSNPTFVAGIDSTATINSGVGNFVSVMNTISSGNYLYVLKGGSSTNCNTVGNKIGCELQIYNISDPSNPTFVAGIDSSANVGSGTDSSSFQHSGISGNYLFIGKLPNSTNCNTVGNKTGCELQIYNIADPSNPTFVAGIDASGIANSGTGSGSFNNIFISGNYTYVAKFSNSTNCNTVGNKVGCELQIYSIVTEYMLRYWSSHGGTVSGGGDQTVKIGFSGISVTAVPDSGFFFSSWSDGSTQNPRTDTNISQNVNIFANFSVLPTIPLPPTSCVASAPMGTPNLFQIDPLENGAVLYFAPVTGANTYHVTYGTNVEANQFATSLGFTEEGVVSHLIEGLEAGTTYYFQVRAVNDCVGGEYSNIGSVKTKGSGSNAAEEETVENLVEDKIPSPPLQTSQPEKPGVCTYIVKQNDNLWKIAEENLGEGYGFFKIAELNGLKSDFIDVGQELKIPCEIADELSKIKEQILKEGVSFDIVVKDINGFPVEGALVTIHSKVQTTKTDKEGIAHFEGVEPGEHRILLSYNSYSGEQKVLVGDSEKEQVSSLQVELSRGVPTEFVLLIVLTMGSIIVVLVLLLLRKNKTRNKFKSRGRNL